LAANRLAAKCLRPRTKPRSTASAQKNPGSKENYRGVGIRAWRTEQTRPGESLLSPPVGVNEQALKGSPASTWHRNGAEYRSRYEDIPATRRGCSALPTRSTPRGRDGKLQNPPPTRTARDVTPTKNFLLGGPLSDAP
jgi:hypothetical protein